MNIASAKPTKEEQNSIPHHLIDIISPEQEYTVYDYQKDVRKLIKEITSRGKRVIIVGGTGLYIKAALYDYNFTEKTTTNDYNDLSNEEIFQRLKQYNIEKIPEISNRRRLVRLLNKCENNEPTTYNKDKCLYPITVIGLTTRRDILYDRINKRVDEMFNNNLLAEINSLKEKYLSSRVLNSAIGYKEFYDYLYNNKSLEDVKSEIKQNSRRFAKRQYTFFKHQFNTTWFDVNFNNFNETINEILNYLYL